MVGVAVTASPVGKNQASCRVPTLAAVMEVRVVKSCSGPFPKLAQFFDVLTTDDCLVVLAPAVRTASLVEETASTVAPNSSAANRAPLRPPVVTSSTPGHLIRPLRGSREWAGASDGSETGRLRRGWEHRWWHWWERRSDQTR